MHLCPKCLSVCKNFLRPRVFCAKDYSLTGRGFWRAEQLRWVETNFEEMREVDQCSEKMKTVEKNLLWWHVRRDGMRWEEMRWGEKSSRGMCKCEVRSVGCEACTVKCEESVRLALHCAEVVRRSGSWTTSVQQPRTKHARTGLAGARRVQILWMKKVL